MTPRHALRPSLAVAVALVVTLGGAERAWAEDPDASVPMLPPGFAQDLEQFVEHAVGRHALAALESLDDRAKLGELGNLAELAELADLDAVRVKRAARSQGQGRRAERTDRTSQRIALGADGRLELRNVAGDITVTAGGGTDVVLDIVKRSRGRTEADAALGLERVEVSVVHRGDRASVETIYPRGRNPFEVVTIYNVTAPAGTRLAVRSVSGNVSVDGITGDVVVDAVSGNVTLQNTGSVSRAQSISGEIRLIGISTDGEVSVGSVSGNVTAANVKARRLAAENVSGTIRAENVGVETALLKSLSGDVHYEGTLSRSGRYEFDSHSGTVRIAVPASAGFELRATSFSGRVRPEGVSPQSVSTNGGQVRATVGDGSAVVVARTFSGDVVLTRR